MTNVKSGKRSTTALFFLLTILLCKQDVLPDTQPPTNMEDPDSALWTTYLSNTSLSKILWDSQRGNGIVVGARNNLQRQDRGLNLIQEVPTGPAVDRQSCTPVSIPCDDKLKNVDNVVTVLKDLSEEDFLVCGSVSGGLCRIYNKINLAAEGVGVDALTDDLNFSEVAHTVSDISSDGRTLFIAAFDSHRDGPNWFLIAVDIAIEESEARKLTMHRSYHSNQDLRLYTVFREFCSKVDYMYSFVHNSFWYLVQKLSLTSELRLARINDNTTLAFYSSVSLGCSGINRTLILVAAKAHGQSLYVVASVHDHKNNTTTGSSSVVLCTFAMSSIEQTFRKQEFCLEPYNKWSQTKPVRPLYYRKLCGAGLVSAPEKEHVLDFLQAGCYSFDLLDQNGDLVALCLTRTGQLYKVALAQDRSPTLLYVIQLDPWLIPESRAPSNNVLDIEHQDLYILTENSVTRFSAGSCSPYSSCQSCSSTEDPLDCAWCQDKCRQRHLCPSPVFTKEDCTSDSGTRTFSESTTSRVSVDEVTELSTDILDLDGNWTETRSTRTADRATAIHEDGAWTSSPPSVRPPDNMATSGSPDRLPAWSVVVIAVSATVLILLLLAVFFLRRTFVRRCKGSPAEDGHEDAESSSGTTLMAVYGGELFKEPRDVPVQETLLNYFGVCSSRRPRQNDPRLLSTKSPDPDDPAA